MTNIKGVVFRISGPKTVIYTEEGEFLTIPTPEQKPRMGQIIEFTPASRSFFKPNSMLKYATAAAVLILVLVLGLLNPLFGSGKAVAAVEMSLNNEFSLQVNKAGEVISARSAGQDPGPNLDGMNLKGTDIYQAIQLIMQNAGEKGVLDKRQSVIIVSVVPVSSGKADVVSPAKLKSVVQKELFKQKAHGVVLVSQASEETKGKAQTLGMTINNYLIYQRCLRDGLDVHADVFRSENAQGAMSKANVSLPKLFPGEYMEVTGEEHNNRQQNTHIERPAEREGRQAGSGDMAPGMDSGHAGQGEMHDLNAPDKNLPSQSSVEINSKRQGWSTKGGSGQEHGENMLEYGYTHSH